MVFGARRVASEPIDPFVGGVDPAVMFCIHTISHVTVMFCILYSHEVGGWMRVQTDHMITGLNWYCRQVVSCPSREGKPLDSTVW